jgi:hypothetical protein
MKIKLMKTVLFAALLMTLSACPGVQALPGTPVPSELQGEWTYGTISSVQYYNPNNGHWGQVNGAGDRFNLEPNGDYERSRLLQLTTYGCESYLFIWEKGTIKLDFDKSQITFQPADGAVKSQSCSAANSYEKKGPGSVKPETYDAEMGEDSNGKTLLRLNTLDGKGSALYGRPQ